MPQVGCRWSYACAFGVCTRMDKRPHLQPTHAALEKRETQRTGGSRRTFFLFFWRQTLTSSSPRPPPCFALQQQTPACWSCSRRRSSAGTLSSWRSSAQVRAAAITALACCVLARLGSTHALTRRWWPRRL